MNPYWSNRTSDPAAWDEPERLRRLFKVCKWLQIALFPVAVLGVGLYLAQASRTPSAVLVAGDGRSYFGTYQPYHLQEDQFTTFVQDVLRGMFLMTEKGPFPHLDPYVAPAAAEQFKKEWGDAVKVFEGSGYFQDIRIRKEDIRIADNGATWVEVKIKSVLVSRAMNNYSSSDVFLYTQFRRVQQSEENPIGWKLFGIVRISADEYFSAEIEAKRKEVLGQQSAAQPMQTSGANETSK